MDMKKDVNLPDDLIKSIWQGHQTGKSVSREIAEEIKRTKTTITDLLKVILMVGSLPAEVCLHTRFGVRYLNLITVIAGLLFLEVPKHVLEDGAVTAGWIAQGAFLLLALVHMTHTHLAEQKRDYTHSRSPGQPWSIWRLLPRQQTPFDIQRVVEPVLVVVSGIAIATVNEYGVFVIAMGIILFLKQTVIFQQYRKQMLDQRDSMIEAEVMNEQEDGKRSMRDNKGYVVPSEMFKWRKKAESNGPSVEEAMAAEGMGTDGTGEARSDQPTSSEVVVRPVAGNTLSGSGASQRALTE